MEIAQKTNFLPPHFKQHQKEDDDFFDDPYPKCKIKVKLLKMRRKISCLKIFTHNSVASLKIPDTSALY